MKYKKIYAIAILFVCSVFVVINANPNDDYSDDEDYLVGRRQEPYQFDELPQDKFHILSNLSDMKHLREAAKRILIPRIVGTEGHKLVRDYIIDSLRHLNWHVETHKFHDEAPIMGKLHFHNIIATLNPNAERYLVLACHYDSKYMPDIEFIGATDSAIPCAMLLNLAHVLKDHLATYSNNTKLSLMLLFFDGEEAFDKWGPKDSIYGARHLAKRWHKDDLIDRIDILVLLDLLGAPDPKFYSFFENTELWYSNFINIEDRLSKAGLLERYITSGIARQYPNRYFQPNAMRTSYIEDDHIPFMKLGVPILHLIPMPFPSVWHTKDDNESVVDYVTTENLGRIIRMFTVEYLYSSSIGNDTLYQKNEI